MVRLIVEADPSGGSLAARWSSAHGLTWDPGLLTLSTSRSVLTADALGPLTQRLTGDVLVAAAPPAPEQVIGALARWGDRGAAELAAAEGVRAFVDCGRLTAASPALTLARRAALTVLVCRPRLDEVNALVPAVAELTAAGCTLGLVCMGNEPYLPAEIANAAGLPLLGVLPVDTRAAATFDRDGLDSGRSFRRSALAHTAAELTEYVRSRAVEILGGDHRPAGPGPVGSEAPDPGSDPAGPDPARAPAGPDTEPAGEGGAPTGDGGSRAPGPTRLSNPVGPANGGGLPWPPPRPTSPAAGLGPPPTTLTMPPPAPSSPQGPPPAGTGEAPPPSPPQGPPADLSPVERPAHDHVIPVSLAVAAARARAQGRETLPGDPGDGTWPPPPPQPVPTPDPDS